MGQSFQVGGLSHLSFDLDANGIYLYLAVINNGTVFPEVLRMNSDLDEDATADYAPNSGSVVNVACGDLDAGIVWAVGDFGSDRIVKHDDIRGEYWYSKDSPDWSGVNPLQPFHLGPMDDNLIMIIDNSERDLEETYFVGDELYWLQRNTDIPFDVGAMDRWDSIPEELLVGIEDQVYFYSDSNIMEFSPFSGEVFGDVSTGLSAVNVTSVITG